MSRLAIFEREFIEDMRGLSSLTEPGPEESVGAVVDVAVIGARGDGKTQFIVHAIRTLRAYAPDLSILSEAERNHNRDILDVVMNARAPRPEATAPGVIPHYVFRIRPHALLSQLGLGGRLGLYARTAGLIGHWLLAAVNAVCLGAVLAAITGGLSAIAIMAAIASATLGAAFGALLSRRRFIGRGEIEIVFWDVAGEHVYSASAADYYGFLSALVHRRRQRAKATERAYAFAPVLLCNPIALGTRTQGSPYTRMRQLLPMFATLNEPLPHALIAINRWSIVDLVCAPDADRDQLVAVIPRARNEDHEPELTHEAKGASSREPGPSAIESPAQPHDKAAEADAPPGDADHVAHLPPLPVVRREVVRAHCLDAEDERDSDLALTYLRYDAGMQCELHLRAWTDFSGQSASVRTRWRPPSEGVPNAALDYVYEDGPGSFQGLVRGAFLHWLAALAYHRTSYHHVRRPSTTSAPANTDAGSEHYAAQLPASIDPVAPAAAHTTHPGEWPGAPPPASSLAPDPAPSPAPGPAPSPAQPPAQSSLGTTDRSEHDGSGQRPPSLSANGLEEFSRGTMTGAIALPASSLQPAAGDSVADGDVLVANPAAHNGQDHGAAASMDGTDMDGTQLGSGRMPMNDPIRREQKKDTMPITGGFGSSGT